MTPPTTLTLTRTQRLGARALAGWTVALLAPVASITVAWLAVAAYGVTVGVLVVVLVVGGLVHVHVAPIARAATTRWYIEHATRPRRRSSAEVEADDDLAAKQAARAQRVERPLGPSDVLARLDADMESWLDGRADS